VILSRFPINKLIIPFELCDVKENVIYQTRPLSSIAPWSSADVHLPIVVFFGHLLPNISHPIKVAVMKRYSLSFTSPVSGHIAMPDRYISERVRCLCKEILRSSNDKLQIQHKETP